MGSGTNRCRKKNDRREPGVLGFSTKPIMNSQTVMVDPVTAWDQESERLLVQKLISYEIKKIEINSDANTLTTLIMIPITYQLLDH